MKKFLRKLFKPLFRYLEYTAVDVKIDFDESTKGLVRKVIGIYASLNHSKNASKGEVWSYVIPEQRQVELAGELTKAKVKSELENFPTRSQYVHNMIAEICPKTKNDAEIIWIIDLVSYEQGYTDAKVRGGTAASVLGELFKRMSGGS